MHLFPLTFSTLTIFTLTAGQNTTQSTTGTKPQFHEYDMVIAALGSLTSSTNIPPTASTFTTTSTLTTTVISTSLLTTCTSSPRATALPIPAASAVSAMPYNAAEALLSSASFASASRTATSTMTSTAFATNMVTMTQTLPLASAGVVIPSNTLSVPVPYPIGNASHLAANATNGTMNGTMLPFKGGAGSNGVQLGSLVVVLIGVSGAFCLL